MCWKHIVLLLPALLIIEPLLRVLFHNEGVDLYVVPALIWFIFVDETLFYWIHRMLHLPFFYKRIHYIHHSMDDKELYSLIGEYSHFIENFFNDIVPLLSGPFIWAYFCPMNISIFVCWMIFRQIRSMDAHSNYDFPYHPMKVLSPIYDGARQHLSHHTLKGRRTNFGGFNIWDKLMGTDRIHTGFSLS